MQVSFRLCQMAETLAPNIFPSAWTQVASSLNLKVSIPLTQHLQVIQETVSSVLSKGHLMLKVARKAPQLVQRSYKEASWSKTPSFSVVVCIFFSLCLFEQTFILLSASVLANGFKRNKEAKLSAPGTSLVKLVPFKRMCGIEQHCVIVDTYSKKLYGLKLTLQ